MNQSKRCRKCDETKPLDGFHKQASSRDGRQAYCRSCNSRVAADSKRARKLASPEYVDQLRQYRANHYAENREAQMSAARAWRAENTERVRATAEAYAAKYPERVRDTQRRYREANTDRRHETFREWSRANPEKARIRLHRRRARMSEVLHVPYTAAQVAQRFSMFLNKCWMCGGEATTIDHVKPISRGGADILANLRPACSRDNSAKRDRWFGVSDLNVFKR